MHRKVVWSEGMFIQPQHFQQQDRYFEYLLATCNRMLNSYAWGFADYEINLDLLEIGKIGLTSGKGLFPDGTEFCFPSEDELPAEIEIPHTARDQLIYLALPIRQMHQCEISDEKETQSLRYQRIECERIDNASPNSISTNIALAKLKPILRLSSSDLSRFTTLAIAKIIERRSDGKIILDDSYIPPLLNCHAATKLQLLLKELKALAQQRAQQLAEQVNDINRNTTTATISNFLLLQTANRFSALFVHYAQQVNLHPQQLYLTMLELVASLTSFGQGNKILPAIPAYQHNDLAASFKPLMREIRQALSAVLDAAAICLPLTQQKFGIQTTVINDRTLFDCAKFVLAVRADINTEALLQQFPVQTKIGPADRIRQLMNLQLPGIVLRSLPTAPPQIPFNSRYSYFEMDNHGEMWEHVKNAGNIAIHTSGDLPNLQLELWTIRGSLL